MGANIWASQSSVVYAGSYALHAECNDTPTSFARFYTKLNITNPPLNFVNGEEGKFEFWARHVGTGGDWRIAMGASTGLADHIIVVLTSADTEWQKYSIEFTYDNTYAYFGAREYGPNTGGIYLDNLSVRKKL